MVADNNNCDNNNDDDYDDVVNPGITMIVIAMCSSSVPTVVCPHSAISNMANCSLNPSFTAI